MTCRKRVSFRRGVRPFVHIYYLSQARSDPSRYRIYRTSVTRVTLDTHRYRITCASKRPIALKFAHIFGIVHTSCAFLEDTMRGVVVVQPLETTDAQLLVITRKFVERFLKRERVRNKLALCRAIAKASEAGVEAVAS